MPEHGAPRSIDELRDQVAAVLGEPSDALGDDDDLIDAGLDSVRLMTLVTRWEADGAEVALLALAEQPTLAAWCRMLAPA